MTVFGYQSAQTLNFRTELSWTLFQLGALYTVGGGCSGQESVPGTGRGERHVDRSTGPERAQRAADTVDTRLGRRPQQRQVYVGVTVT